MVCDDPGGTYIEIVNAIRSNFKIVVYTLLMLMELQMMLKMPVLVVVAPTHSDAM